MLQQLLLNGIIAGSIYSLVALGFALIYQTTRGKATPLELLLPPAAGQARLVPRGTRSRLPTPSALSKESSLVPIPSGRKVGHFPRGQVAQGGVYTFGAYASATLSTSTSIPLKAGLSTGFGYLLTLLVTTEFALHIQKYIFVYKSI